MRNFTLIGAAGYIAPRHMKAIRDTGNNLVAAYDPFDSVGIIDANFPNADFFTEFERFDRHTEKIRRAGNNVDYVSICSPNYLHDSHIRFAMRHNAEAICEKPLVLNPWNVDALEVMEEETGKRVWNILQLRVHPTIIALKEEIKLNPGKVHDVELTYITSRGHWYYTSWKGDESKSGGIATNIGVHFFDMLTWIFGKVQKNVVHMRLHDRASGFLQLSNANVKWFLSINADTLPPPIDKSQQRTFRSITIDNKELEFSGGFTELHTLSYNRILKGDGFGLPEARSAIEVTHDIRHAKVSRPTGDYHPFLKKPLAKHPFGTSN